MTTLAEYDARLRGVDWHYQRSDDPREYRRGEATFDAIHGIDRESPDHLRLLLAWRDCAHSPLPREQARATRDAVRRELGVLD